ncbi:molybdopterin-dependent oxidoreductase [Caenimonas soli]|uniref:molybdopterin-dependent oxidoreductase n=1 Tax=Caenimonas soli TaxID=2735555 RepID=UPI0015576453|nr:molybdopterin-dependent oxidoreductase [Caenimonas soli]NPC58542.1 molybdopterin-dependent oxidoreductase [Caenimonas soli]
MAGPVPHSSHWGAFSAEAVNGRVTRIIPFEGDPSPSPLLRNFEGEGLHRARVTAPAVRRGWLEARGRGTAHRSLRGTDDYVEVPWDEALSLVADELRRVYGEYGASAVYGSSYGWASAGRFHHAQSQVHRFLNTLGGYIGSVNTYSQGASAVVFPHVLGITVNDLLQQSTSWDTIAAHTKLFLAFGGIPLKNAAVCAGGTGEHLIERQLRAAYAAGTRFVLVSPQRSDLPDWLEPEWLPIEPGTDAALMLALAHVLDAERLADRDFLARYCVGAEEWLAYVRGATDGIAKSPQWAASITGIAASRIVSLARRLASHRSLITTSWSLQRSWHGEQPIWASIALAALLGQIGLPGGGVGHGYGMTASTGQRFVAKMPTMDQGRNPVIDYIPVARVADMLLRPGATYEYNGCRLQYPQIRMVYWCGGNPFHHHQDLVRLRTAFAQPETIVVHEPYWTATARHADIVLPATTTLERNDIGCSGNARHVFAMKQVIAPVGGARSDFDIFSALAQRFGVADTFCEGRNEMAWLELLYEQWRAKLPSEFGDILPFKRFWEAGVIELPAAPQGRRQVLLAAFREDPERQPLNTPSGRIEITSQVVKGFKYPECPGHAVWNEPSEWHGAPLAKRYPLMLIANNPQTRLHSQLDAGPYSAGSKIQGREPLRMHPEDAGARGLNTGDVVRVFNDRGSLLAGVCLSDDLKPGVMQIATGAWLDLQRIPGGALACVHGNPNVLTQDQGTSPLAQGCIGQLSLVEVEPFGGKPPALTCWDSGAGTASQPH